jgi:hypothetical protein
MKVITIDPCNYYVCMTQHKKELAERRDLRGLMERFMSRRKLRCWLYMMSVFKLLSLEHFKIENLKYIIHSFKTFRKLRA